MPPENETVPVRKDDLDTLVAACTSYLPADVNPEVTEAFSRVLEPFDEVHGIGEEVPASPSPPGRYGRIEIPGYRENTGWITEETRFGLQVAVVRDKGGEETAMVTPGPACRIVWLAVPVSQREPAAALPAGGWAEETGDPDDDEDAF